MGFETHHEGIADNRDYCCSLSLSLFPVPFFFFLFFRRALRKGHREIGSIAEESLRTWHLYWLPICLLLINVTRSKGLGDEGWDIFFRRFTRWHASNILLEPWRIFRIVFSRWPQYLMFTISSLFLLITLLIPLIITTKYNDNISNVNYDIRMQSSLLYATGNVPIPSLWSFFFFF